MYKIFLSLVSLTVFLSAELSVEQIEQMVLKIHEKRQGVKLETLAETKEPFAFGENTVTLVEVIEKVEKKEPKLLLYGIMNGKAYINNAWRGLGDNILGYTLKSIGKKGVVLRKGNHSKKLDIRKKRDNFIKTIER